MNINRFTYVSMSILIIAVMLAGCNDKRVMVPPKSADTPPVITITSVPSPGGKIEEFSASTNRDLAVLSGSQIALSANATNPGGVWSLSLGVDQGSNRLFSITSYGGQRLLNGVPNTLRITGTQGLSGDPLIVTLNVQNAPVVVTAVASNYNGQENRITVRYVPYEHITADLQADKQQVAPGEQFTLTWRTGWASHVVSPFGGSAANGSETLGINSTTTFRLSAYNGLETVTREVTVQVYTPAPTPPRINTFRVEPRMVTSGSGVNVTWSTSSSSNCTPIINLRVEDFFPPHSLISTARVPPSSTLTDHPSKSVNYILTTKCQEGGASNEQGISVGVTNSTVPPASWTWFYFKLENRDSYARPCFTLAWLEADEQSALRDVVSGNPGYTVTPIDVSEFGNACG